MAFSPTKPYVQNKSAYKEKILKLIQKTWNTPYVSVENQVVKKKFSFPEYGHTDGIGKVVPGSGKVIIESAFSNKKIIF